MGLLSPHCITADPSTTTLYGLAYAANQTQQPQVIGPVLFVLFQSQPNPSNISDARWSVVSTFPGSLDMMGRNAIGFSCAITAKGVFTAFASYPMSKPGTEEEPLEGLRYEPAGPAMDSAIGVQGGGRWSVVNVAKDYNRTEVPRYSGQKLYIVGDGPDARLVHAYVDEVEGFVRFGVVDETSSRPSLTYSSSFQSTSLQLSRKTTIAFEKNTSQLFIYSPATDRNASVPILTSISLVNGTIPPSPLPDSGFKFYEANSTYDCRYSSTVFSATYEGSYFLYCKDSYTPENGTRSQLATLKTPTSDTTIQRIMSIIYTSSESYELTHFQPIGGHLPNQTAFAVISSDYTVAGINLVTGETQYSHNVIVNGTLGGGAPISSPKPSNGENGGANRFGLEIALGVITSVIFMIAMYFLCRKKNKHGKWMGNWAGADENDDERPRRPTEVDAGAIELGDRRQREYRHSQDDDIVSADPPPVYESRGRDAQARAQATAPSAPPAPPA
ncbi:hypothetical protein BKA57DRAFT_458920 [Linnemannia elongata]|nr:hypothetical protein BKA57DRAFT_458920 [Linnemannia elongata]